MYLSDAARYAAQAANARRIMRRRGTTPQGHALWTKREDALCRKHYPDYRALQDALPRRTKAAIKFRCGTLGIARKVHVWTGADHAKFRRLYAHAPLAEVFAAFPHLSESAIKSKAVELGVHRPRMPYTPTGNYILDELRQECFRRKINMRDLDEFAGSKGYFVSRGWHGSRATIKYNAIVRGIHELGGRLRVNWGEDE